MALQKKLPKPLEGVPKVIVPPNNAPECLREAFWAGYTSDYLDASTTHTHWTKACKAYSTE